MGKRTVSFVTSYAIQTFKIQSGILKCNPQKGFYLLKCRICGQSPYVGQVKTKFSARGDSYKSAHMS